MRNRNGSRLPQDVLIGDLLVTGALQQSVGDYDIHRDRDHGVPDYATVKKFCSGDSSVNSENGKLRDIYG